MTKRSEVHASGADGLQITPTPTPHRAVNDIHQQRRARHKVTIPSPSAIVCLPSWTSLPFLSSVCVCLNKRLNNHQRCALLPQ